MEQHLLEASHSLNGIRAVEIVGWTGPCTTEARTDDRREVTLVSIARDSREAWAFTMPLRNKTLVCTNNRRHEACTGSLVIRLPVSHIGLLEVTVSP